MTKEQDKLESLKERVIVVQNDVAWLKKFFWIVAVASVGGWVTSFLNLASGVAAK